MATGWESEVESEAAYLRGAYIQNELARDTFLGVGSTTAFAASIAFVADIVQLSDASWPALLWFAWLMFVVSILALVISFETSRRGILHGIKHIHDQVPPTHRLSAVANVVPAWTFCAGILLLFVFITVNLEKSQMTSPNTPVDHSKPKPGGGVNPAPRPQSSHLANEENVKMGGYRDSGDDYEKRGINPAPRAPRPPEPSEDERRPSRDEDE